ncbi:MAG: hypothetical protein JWQ98_151 [Chlorobi bacterium]|nr:hypothetical protein [Chlorobiota bacterium]
MANETNDRNIQNYIERITALQNERNSALSMSDLQSVARELGMSDDDLAAAEREAVNHRTRGMGLMRQGLWDNAVSELSASVGLHPSDVESLHGLAAAYAGRYREKADEGDRAQAESYAQQALAIDPNHAATFSLLGDLKKSSQGEPTRISPVARKRLTIVAVAVIVVALVLIFLLVLGANSNTTPAPMP